MRGNPKTHAFCYLYNEAPHTHEFGRHDEKTAVLLLPKDPGKTRLQLVVPYDHRDQRALVVFDGDLPWCGLPKAADQIAEQYLHILRSSMNHQRKLRDFELNPPYPGGSEMLVPLRRRALLLPAGKTLILRYRDRSLAGAYCLITVKRHDKDEVDVEFINTDY